MNSFIEEYRKFVENVIAPSYLKSENLISPKLLTHVWIDTPKNIYICVYETPINETNVTITIMILNQKNDEVISKTASIDGYCSVHDLDTNDTPKLLKDILKANGLIYLKDCYVHRLVCALDTNISNYIQIHHSFYDNDTKSFSIRDNRRTQLEPLSWDIHRDRHNKHNDFNHFCIRAYKNRKKKRPKKSGLWVYPEDYEYTSKKEAASKKQYNENKELSSRAKSLFQRIDKDIVKLVLQLHYVNKFKPAEIERLLKEQRIINRKRAKNITIKTIRSYINQFKYFEEYFYSINDSLEITSRTITPKTIVLKKVK